MDSRCCVFPVRVAAFIGLLLFGMLSVTPCQADKTADLNERIKKSGGLWVARDNAVSRLPEAERKKLLGTIIDPVVESQMASSMRIFKAFGDEPLPAKLDYRDINGQNFVTPVRNQGSCGSCWAFSTTAALESAVLRTYNRPGENVDLAEQVLVSCSSAGSCDGGYPYSASTFLRNNGIPPESCYPYTRTDGNCTDACGDRTDISFKVTEYVYISRDVEALKAALVTYGPFSTAYRVCSDFWKYSEGVYVRDVEATRQGGHAVLLVGYDDDAQAFICKNSWGSGWAKEGGYFRIHYSMVDDSDVQFGMASVAYSGAVDPLMTNQPPQAQAGAVNDVHEGDRVTLNGTNSNDPDGEIASYQWTQTGGPDVQLIDENTATAEFTAPGTDDPDGITLTFRLTVTDDAGTTDDDSVSVRVLRNNRPPTAAASATSPVTEGEIVTLNGSNSTDPERGALNFQWEQRNGPSVVFSDASAATCTFEAPDSDDPDGVTLTFRLTVTDDGNMSDQAEVLVNVRWVNDPPTASAGDDLHLTEGQEVILDGKGSTDPEGHPLTYQWRQLTGETVTLSDPRAAETRFTAPAVTDSNGYALQFRLEVEDNGGLTAADEVIVNLSRVNDPPAAAATAPDTVTEGDVVTLNGAGSTDDDDGIVKYQWRQIGGTPVTLDTPDQANTTFTAPDSGTAESIKLQFELTVTDAGGLATTAGIELTVQAQGDTPDSPDTPSVIPANSSGSRQANTMSGDSGSGCWIGTLTNS